MADANQLEMALLNLTVNARDAMADGGEIIVAARQEIVDAGRGGRLKPGAYVCVSVSDSGEGMDENTLRRAVEPFFTTKGLDKGTGLGLSMVHGFAEQSGGCFILHSRKGEGTTAEIWLPVAKTSAKTVGHAQSKTAPTPLQPPPDRPGGRRRCPRAHEHCRPCSKILVTPHFEAYSGKEALEILRREDFVDLVITDQAMPQMSGTQLAKTIRVEWPDIPVLLATGYADRVPGEDTRLAEACEALPPARSCGGLGARQRLSPARANVSFRSAPDSGPAA